MSTDLRQGLAKWLSYTKPVIEHVRTCTVTGPIYTEMYGFAKRAAIVRQTEALGALVSMDEAGHAHFGVTFLRPAFEEVIWFEYLQQHAAVANEIINLLGIGEITASITAQEEYLGGDTMGALGFSAEVISAQKAMNRQKERRLKKIGKQLGWHQDRSPLPSMSWLAKQVGRQQDYRFLYHATSRYVHFSQHELMRRVWGVKRVVTVGSTQFSKFWRDFAFYWGLRTHMEILGACADVFGDVQPAEAEREEISVYLRSFEMVPLITTWELTPPVDDELRSSRFPIDDSF